MIETLRFVAIVVLAGIGVFFTFVSAMGVIRLPDVYARAHTASQVDTLGAGFTLAAVALALGWQHATVYTVLLLFFVFLTNPTAAHAIARSAAESGIEPWTPVDAVPPTGAATDSDSDADPESGTGPDVAADGSGATDGESSAAPDADADTDADAEGGNAGGDGR